MCKAPSLREWGSDSDAMHLGRAAKIVGRHVFDEQKPFIGFQEGCQRDSVPNLLLALVNKIL